MSNIPLHLQRRFEQRWASRFTQPVASNVPKNVGTKATPSTARRPQDDIEKVIGGQGDQVVQRAQNQSALTINDILPFIIMFIFIVIILSNASRGGRMIIVPGGGFSGGGAAHATAARREAW